MTSRLPAAIAASLLTLAAAAHAAVPAPKVEIASFAELKTPLPYPYDEAGDADPKAVDARIAKAKGKARRQGKLLLVDLGGNWCGDCRVLAATMETPALKRFMDSRYVVEVVDTGRMDRNLQVPARWGVDRLEGVPSLLIVDPTTDRLLNAGHVAALADARKMSPQALADWLAQWPK